MHYGELRRVEVWFEGCRWDVCFFYGFMEGWRGRFDMRYLV